MLKVKVLLEIFNSQKAMFKIKHAKSQVLLEIFNSQKAMLKIKHPKSQVLFRNFQYPKSQVQNLNVLKIKCFVRDPIGKEALLKIKSAKK